MLGTNRFGELKANAAVLATSPGPAAEPVMISMDFGQGRVIAFGGETWVWSRQTEEGRLAYRKFWRQIDFLALSQGRRQRESGQAQPGPAANWRG